ncbi:putative capsid protein [Cronartium ribicola totivirus 2]|uniref:Putative capsid protein n=1 Tax=Cronartium ribicola totivirus 2 TaxID=2687248 RepID=A0A6B9F0I9_9VIRU|nr:putative capsid protein [Cronartium ribicola totivirus 2]
MDSFSELINYNASPLSIVNGEVWTRTDLRLKVLNVEAGKILPSDIQQNKKPISQLPSGTGEVRPHDMRHTSHCISKGTVYGKPCTWSTDVTHNSLAGINKTCLTTDGTISFNAVAKYLREVANNIDAREQRLNLYYDTVYSMGYYDNFTALLLNIQAKIILYDIVAKMNTHTVKTEVDLVTAYNLANASGDARSLIVFKLLTTGSSAAGIARYDPMISRISEQILSWYDQLDDTYTQSSDIVNANNDKVGKLILSYEVWAMYTYDDGHSKSGDHFGDHFGFIQGRYIKSTALFTTRGATNINLIPTKGVVPETDEAIVALREYQGTLNLVGFSSKEVCILHHMMAGNKRPTPFLIDQDLDLGCKKKNFRVFNSPEITLQKTELNAEDLLSLLNKLIKNHRLHEENKQAAVLLKYWVAQPGTETLESHFWTHLPRYLSLPRFSAQRAGLPMLLSGDGVCISVDAIKYASNLSQVMRSMLFYSMFVNTCRQWGEYLATFNAVNTDKLMRQMRHSTAEELDEMTRMDSLLSAITGKQVLQCAFRDCGTRLDGPLSSHTQIHVPIGQISIPQMTEYGYVLHGTRLTFGKLVTPGAVALVTGLNGSLIASTPYSAQFSINPMVTIHENGEAMEGMNYNDLWAYGVLARWNGHDLHYYHPYRDGQHKIYAANDVSIAVPPVPLINARRTESYKLGGITRRTNSWGSNMLWAVEGGISLMWERIRSDILIRPEWGAPRALTSVQISSIAREMRIDLSVAETYLGTVSTRYLIEQSDFQVDYTSAAVAMPGELNKSDLLTVEEEGEPPPLDASAGVAE